jgi:DNA polymerase-3 subunit epsilon
MGDKRCIVLDTETTGLSPSKDRIIEIGAIELINGERTSNTFNKYINPQVSLPKIITDITGITDEILIDKPVFKDIVNEFLEWVGDSKIIAHNAKFDIGFINSELGRIGLMPLKNEVLCTMLWYRSMYPGEKSSLDALCIKFGIVIERTKHGALLDASILVDVYNAMCFN